MKDTNTYDEIDWLDSDLCDGGALCLWSETSDPGSGGGLATARSGAVPAHGRVIQEDGFTR
jgi:hypothetical protein